MTSQIRPLAVACVLAVASLGTAQWIGSEAAPPNKPTKIVELDCKNGYRGSAGGAYGGVPFSISCNYDRQSIEIGGVSGTDYSVRMGVETFTTAFDCFFSGSAGQVREACAKVTLIVR
jgi:hypothetical protein